MKAPPLLNNTGQRGVFVLPLNIPGANGAAPDTYDDFNFDAAAWTMSAHEARPGHELQFDSMVERGVSLARVIWTRNAHSLMRWFGEFLHRNVAPPKSRIENASLAVPLWPA